MLRTTCLTLLLGAGLTLGGCTKAEESTPETPESPSTQPEKTASIKTINAACPVSDHAVDPSATTVSFQGHTIGFCCDDCIPNWNEMSEADKLAFVKDMEGKAS